MIKLFVTDIDGCLSEPYAPYDLDGFATLRRLAQEAGLIGEGEAPSLSVCSGRAYPYVEAITQALHVRTPVLFEGGGGRFDPEAAQTTWNPAFTEAIEAEIDAVRHWFVTEITPGTSLSLDHAKRTQAGVVSPDPGVIADVRRQTEQFVADEAPDLQVFATDVSVDVVPPGITKRSGLDGLADHLDLSMNEMAYIGDTEADLEALSAVGTSFAPTNADAAVRERVDHVTDGSVMEGTIAAYRACLPTSSTPTGAV